MFDRLKNALTNFRKPTGAKTLRVKNRYDAGAGGRRLGMWTPGTPGPNAAILADLDLVRARSRDATRNNGWIKRAIDLLVSNEIGEDGIRPRSRAPDKEYRKAADALFEEWAKAVAYYAFQKLAVRNRYEAGEIFIRLRPRLESDGLPVPLQLQPLEAEHCPSNMNEALPTGGRTIRAGIEFNNIGEKTAFWMYRSHPGESFPSVNIAELVPVPADSVIHHFVPLRPGQIRGVPWTTQALIKSKDFDEYDDAELVRKKHRSVHTGAITRAAYADDDYKFDPFSGEPINGDDAGVPVMTTQPGSLVALLPGEDLKFFEGDNTGSGYADFVRQQLMGVAAAMNIPYEFLTGDMSKVNDRTMRVILNEFHRFIGQIQWLYTIPQICQPVWEAFMDKAVLAGKLKAPDYFEKRAEYLRVDWRPPRWPYINPTQDVAARRDEVAAGFASRSSIIAELGEDAEEIDEQNAEDKRRADSLGLTYETHSAKLADPAAADTPEEAAAALAFRRVNARYYQAGA